MLVNHPNTSKQLSIRVFETNSRGAKLEKVENEVNAAERPEIKVLPDQEFQRITGFGGSFTQSTAFVLNQLSKNNRASILEAYFGDDGSKYSLTRTHINSCDFSTRNYAYANVAEDRELKHFSIEEDLKELVH
jgi:glucosylceramidase